MVFSKRIVSMCGIVNNWYYFLAAIICSVILITTVRVRHFQHASDQMLNIFSVYGSVCLNPYVISGGCFVCSR